MGPGRRIASAGPTCVSTGSSVTSRAESESARLAAVVSISGDQLSGHPGGYMDGGLALPKNHFPPTLFERRYFACRVDLSRTAQVGSIASQSA